MFRGSYIVEYIQRKVNRYVENQRLLKEFYGGGNLIFNNLLEIAQSKNLSISKLERLAGLSKGTISKWKTASPTIDNLQAVAKVLEVKVDKLLEEGRE